MRPNSRARDLLRKFQVPDQHRDLVNILESGQTGRLTVDPVDDVLLLAFRMRNWHPVWWWRWWEVHRFKRQDVVEAINRLNPNIPDDGVDIVFERFIVQHERVPVVGKGAAHLRIGVDYLGNLIDRTEAPSLSPMSRAQRRADRRFVLATGVIFATANDLTPLIAQFRRAQPGQWSN